MKKIRFWVAAACALNIAFLAPPILHFALNPFVFNQFLIEKYLLSHGDLAAFFRSYKSVYSSGLNIVLGRAKFQPPPFEKKDEFFKYFFSWLPSYCVVYPTEGFYYFVTKLDNAAVSGNIRIADLDKNKLSYAYFTVNEPERKTISGEMEAGSDLAIEKHSDSLYDVTLHGKKVRFEIPRTDLLRPQKLNLLPSEDFIGQVFDESGVRFFLLLNRETDSFYYVLNEEIGIRDRHSEFSPSLEKSHRTGFVYYVDHQWNRRILLGVHLAHIANNSFFDGPGDQVPYRLFIRDFLHKAYPNTMRGKGIDEHGIVLDEKAWARVAITPYVRYSEEKELETTVSECRKKFHNPGPSILWTCMTKEFWNNPGFRKSMVAELKKEGKPYKDIKIFQIPKVVGHHQVAAATSPPKPLSFDEKQKIYAEIRLKAGQYRELRKK